MKADATTLEELQELFADGELLERALTHSSTGRRTDYQRLEFLGDAVIELLVRHWLLDRFPDASEGALTRMKIEMVRGTTLSRCADRLGLRNLVETGPDLSGPGVTDSMAADIFEALIGALYLDGGLEKARDFLDGPLFAFEEPEGFGDPKSRLQEYCQGRGMKRPEYRIAGSTGPSHDPVFTIDVTVDGTVAGRGKAHGRKKAEAVAAAAALRSLEGEDDNGLHA